ncbi:MAG: hypothetical protein HY696_05625 [Deltaproteobacteria bacterium]|nr:hypothetical protein [Deltaproteobacteria bacterium]
MQRRLFLVVPLAFGLAWTLAMGCSGGVTGSVSTGGTGGATGDTSVPGLEVASQMALVSANESGSPSLAKSLRGLKAEPTSGDYVTDEAEIFVYDRSMEALDQFNEIMCSIADTHYADMVNQGNYIALVNAEGCSKSANQSGEASDQALVDDVEYEKWIVNSSRANTESPHIMQAWIPFDDEMGFFDEIRGEMVITEGVSPSNKYGIFQLNFVGYSDGIPVMHAFLSASRADDGQIILQMNMGEEGFMQEMLYAVVSPDGSTGRASMHRAVPSGGGGGQGKGAEGLTFEEKSVHVAFDANHYLSDYGSEQECLDRHAFDEHAWSYNLYGADGARAELNGGMSLQYGDVQGWGSYYGVWFPEEEVTVTSGMAVLGEDDVPLTVFLGEGRLVSRVRHSLQLGDFIGATFKKWDSETASQLHVQWDGSQFLIVGRETCSEGTGCTFAAEAEPIPVVLAANNQFNLWKDGLGSLDLVVPENGIITNEMEIPYYTNDFVAPTDAILAAGPITLKCYTQCLKANITQDEASSGDIYLPEVEDVNAPHEYTFSADDYVLRYNGEPVQVVAGADLTGTMFSWGIHGGAMLLSDVAATLANVWDVWSQDVTYMWESGPNQWNRYSALLDSDGAIVSFDQPWQCLYTHVIPASEASEGSSEKFLLDYQGEGQLHGIPWTEIADEESGFSHWVPEFAISNGSEVVCDGTTYYVRPMEIEQTMQVVDLSACSGLTAEDLGEPTGTFEDPEMDTAPTVTDDPAVVGGVLQ